LGLASALRYTWLPGGGSVWVGQRGARLLSGRQPAVRFPVSQPFDEEGSTMMLLAPLALTAALLTGCAGSSRIGGIAPESANIHTGPVETRANPPPDRSGAAATTARAAVKPQAAPAGSAPAPAPGEE